MTLNKNFYGWDRDQNPTVIRFSGRISLPGKIIALDAKRTGLCQRLTDTLVSTGWRSTPLCVLRKTAASCLGLCSMKQLLHPGESLPASTQDLFCAVCLSLELSVHACREGSKFGLPVPRLVAPGWWWLPPPFVDKTKTSTALRAPSSQS